MSAPATFSFSFIALLGVIVWAVWNIASAGFSVFVPGIEAKYYAPVLSLQIPYQRCVGDDAYLFGNLNKREYRNGVSAEFKGMTVFPADGGDRIPWRRVEEGDESPASRPPGEQGWGVYLFGGCRVPFVIYTRHQSPISGLAIPGTFGPFDPEILR
jgi:hypothetical protein